MMQSCILVTLSILILSNAKIRHLVDVSDINFVNSTYLLSEPGLSIWGSNIEIQGALGEL
jgi:hypothetical protein